MNPKLERLAFKGDSMPSLPSVYKRIRKAVEDPDSTFDDIARIVCNDQSMSARLLRLANSAFYGYPNEVISIPDALTVIGLQQFKNMALCTSVIEVFKNIPPELLDMEEFWKKSIACGLCARILALQRRETNSERFFLGGLLHRVGKLVLYKEMPEDCLSILKTTKERKTLTYHIENEILGFNHADLGGVLLANWELPQSLSDLVSHYIDPTLAEASISDVCLINIADFITESLDFGDSGETYVPEFSEAAWGYSRLDENELCSTVEDLKTQFEDVSRIFLDSN